MAGERQHRDGEAGDDERERGQDAEDGPEERPVGPAVALDVTVELAALDRMLWIDDAHSLPRFAQTRRTHPNSYHATDAPTVSQITHSQKMLTGRHS